LFTYGRGAYRLVTLATSPRPPTDLRVIAVVGNNVTMSFNMPAGGLTPTGYVLEGGVMPGQVLASIPIAADETTVALPVPTGAFYARVHTLAGGLRSAASNEVRLFVNVTARPARSTNLLSLVDGNTLSLAWMNSTRGGAATRMYVVVEDVMNTFVPIPPSESVTFNNVPAGSYRLSVHSVNASGESGLSSAVRVTVPGSCTGIPGAPRNVTATRTGHSVTLWWDLPFSGPAPTSFAVDVTGAYVGSFPVTTRSVSGSVGPGSYTVTVTSRNSCGVSAPTLPVTIVVP
jgi:hypothetical protein